MKTKLLKTFVGLLGLVVFSLVLFSFVSSTAGDPWHVPAKYKKMTNPTDANDADGLKVGKTLYNKHCASCHGKSGVGDGKKADDLETELPDLTSKAFKDQKPGVKYYQSFIGRDEMPNFEKKITDDEDRWFVINYMDSL